MTAGRRACRAGSAVACAVRVAEPGSARRSRHNRQCGLAGTIGRFERRRRIEAQATTRPAQDRRGRRTDAPWAAGTVSEGRKNMTDTTAR